MATVFVSRRRYRVAVYSEDHGPPHVHALGKGRDARYKLNCPDGPVELWDFFGDWPRRHINEVGNEVADKLAECCRVWTEIHG